MVVEEEQEQDPQATGHKQEQDHSDLEFSSLVVFHDQNS
jgi:hypothetical protein